MEEQYSRLTSLKFLGSSSIALRNTPLRSSLLFSICAVHYNTISFIIAIHFDAWWHLYALTYIVIIVSGNGLVLKRHQAITRINAEVLQIVHKG